MVLLRDYHTIGPFNATLTTSLHKMARFNAETMIVHIFKIIQIYSMGIISSITYALTMLA